MKTREEIEAALAATDEAGCEIHMLCSDTGLTSFSEIVENHRSYDRDYPEGPFDFSVSQILRGLAVLVEADVVKVVGGACPSCETIEALKEAYGCGLLKCPKCGQVWLRDGYTDTWEKNDPPEEKELVETVCGGPGYHDADHPPILVRETATKRQWRCPQCRREWLTPKMWGG